MMIDIDIIKDDLWINQRLIVYWLTIIDGELHSEVRVEWEAIDTVDIKE